MLLNDISKAIEATIFNPKNRHLDIHIKDIKPITECDEECISFITDEKYLKFLHESSFAAVITKNKISDLEQRIQLIHPDPALAVAKISQIFESQIIFEPGISDLAYISPSAIISPKAKIHPFSFVDENCVIGDDCEIFPHVYIGANTKIGTNTKIYPNASIMKDTIIHESVIIHANSVIGGDGFGFVPSSDGITKVPQRGRVIIESFVEIGAGTTIDRATFSTTTIKKHSKLDSQVHIGHNVEVGENSMLCAQVGIAGSVKIGKNFIAAGQSGIAHGLSICDNVTLGSKTGVTKDIKKKGQYLGMPAIAASLWKRQAVALKKIPNLLKLFKRTKDN